MDNIGVTGEQMSNSNKKRIEEGEDWTQLLHERCSKVSR